MPAAASSASPPSALQRAAQHLAPLAERRRGQPLHRGEQRRAPAARACGVKPTTADHTLGGGTKAAGGRRSRRFGTRTSTAPAPTAGRRRRCRARRRCARPPPAGTSASAAPTAPPGAASRPAAAMATLYGRLATICRGGGTRRARSSASASAATTRSRGRLGAPAPPSPPPRADRSPPRSRSAAAVASSARVSPPGPGPTSTTWRPARSPASAGDAARSGWRRAGNAGRASACASSPCRAITSRSGGRLPAVPPPLSDARRSITARRRRSRMQLARRRSSTRSFSSCALRISRVARYAEILLLARADHDHRDAVRRHHRLAGLVGRQGRQQLAQRAAGRSPSSAHLAGIGRAGAAAALAAASTVARSSCAVALMLPRLAPAPGAAASVGFCGSSAAGERQEHLAHDRPPSPCRGRSRACRAASRCETRRARGSDC